MGASERVTEAQGRLDHVRKALLETPAVEAEQLVTAKALHADLKNLKDILNGDATVAARQEPTMPGVLGRIESVTGSVWGTTQLPTRSQRQNLSWAEEGLQAVNTKLDATLTSLKALEDLLEVAKAPYTPGRTPR